MIVTATADATRRFRRTDIYGEARVDYRFAPDAYVHALVGGTRTRNSGRNISSAPARRSAPMAVPMRPSRRWNFARPATPTGDVQTLTPGIEQYLGERAWVTVHWVNTWDRFRHSSGWLVRGDVMPNDRLRLFAGVADAPTSTPAWSSTPRSLFGGVSLDVGEHLTCASASLMTIPRDRPTATRWRSAWGSVFEHSRPVLARVMVGLRNCPGQSDRPDHLSKVGNRRTEARRRAREQYIEFAEGACRTAHRHGARVRGRRPHRSRRSKSSSSYAATRSKGFAERVTRAEPPHVFMRACAAVMRGRGSWPPRLSANFGDEETKTALPRALDDRNPEVRLTRGAVAGCEGRRRPPRRVIRRLGIGDRETSLLTVMLLVEMAQTDVESVRSLLVDATERAGRPGRRPPRRLPAATTLPRYRSSRRWPWRPIPGPANCRAISARLPRSSIPPARPAILHCLDSPVVESGPPRARGGADRDRAGAGQARTPAR
jgi:hypothetical protein